MPIAQFGLHDARRISTVVQTVEGGRGRPDEVGGGGSFLSIEIGKATEDADAPTEFPPQSGLVAVKCKIWKYSSAFSEVGAQPREVDPGFDEVDAFDWMGTGIKTDDTVYLFRATATDSARWYFIKAGGGGAGFYFSLNNPLNASDPNVNATIIHGWGGAAGDGQTELVHNMATATPGKYLFAGAQGARGLALQGTNSIGVEGAWLIFQMECSEDPPEGDWSRG